MEASNLHNTSHLCLWTASPCNLHEHISPPQFSQIWTLLIIVQLLVLFFFKVCHIVSFPCDISQKQPLRQIWTTIFSLKGLFWLNLQKSEVIKQQHCKYLAIWTVILSVPAQFTDNCEREPLHGHLYLTTHYSSWDKHKFVPVNWNTVFSVWKSYRDCVHTVQCNGLFCLMTGTYSRFHLTSHSRHTSWGRWTQLAPLPLIMLGCPFGGCSNC